MYPSPQPPPHPPTGYPHPDPMGYPPHPDPYAYSPPDHGHGYHPAPNYGHQSYGPSSYGGGHGMGLDPMTMMLLSGGFGGDSEEEGDGSSSIDPALMMLLGGGMGAGGIDPMALLAMNSNGFGDMDDLFESLLYGDGDGLYGKLTGGEGGKTPSKGILNLIGAGIIDEDEEEDLDGDGRPDHLVETEHKIDDYLAKQWLLGKRKLTVSVNYGNTPLEYLYLDQYHGFPHPLAGTPMGPRFGLPGPKPLPPMPKMPGLFMPPPPPTFGKGMMGGMPGYPMPPPPGYPLPSPPGYPLPTPPSYPQPPQPGYPQPPLPGYPVPPPQPGYPQPSGPPQHSETESFPDAGQK